MDDREQAITAAKQRMADFRLRQTPSHSSATTSTVSNPPSAKLHARSGSRSNSLTDFSLPNSSRTNSLCFDESQTPVAPVPSSPSPRSRPSSHHRRRSSVSTRRESAEMMGVAPPPETGPDSVGDQSELRRLALWTLEGKSHSDGAFIGSFNKVEIPELNTLDTEISSDATQATKTKPTLSTFGMNSALTGKRDSFGKLLISSSNSLKDQLHTLMEEEEEEEDATQKMEEQEVDKEETITPLPSAEHFRKESSYTRPAASLSSRHRPANLTLRPLSLTPESLPLGTSEGLPTPSPTPSPRMSGLKALMLAPSPSPSPAPSNSFTSSAPSRRQSLCVTPSPSPKDYMQRRQSISAFTSPTPSLKRKSSISYKRTNSSDHPSGSLLTPEPTPTSPLPPLHAALPSLSSSSTGLVPDLDRPLSPTEQAFLFRSHTSLLCRISDLEQAIAGGRPRLSPGIGTVLPTSAVFKIDEEDNSMSYERPTSITSMSTMSEPESLPSQPSDEMLQLVSHLKSERDELMRDADGWRTRVSDQEKQICTLTRRVEAERREAWVVRERLGLVEVEKKRIKEDMERCRLECRRLEKALRSEEGARAKAEEERDVLGNLLNAERRGREEAERKVDGLRVELEQLCARAEQADTDLQALLVTPKVEMTMQVPVARRFSSVDSQMSTSSITDVDEYLPVGIRTLKLNAVEEEVEDRDIPRDVSNVGGIDSDNDELAHYEDDEDLDDDMIFGDDQTSSSFGSVVRSNSHLLRLDIAATAPAPAPVPSLLPSHAKSGSMERGWSFPQSHGKSSPAPRDPPKVDHFFECLDALDEIEMDEAGVLPTYNSATAKQFWRGAVQDVNIDEMPPFVLPAQPRKEKDWKEIEAAKLEAVAEEEEEDILLRFPSLPASSAKQSAHPNENDAMTPRAVLSNMSQVRAGTPTRHVKVRKTSMDLTIPGFKPYSGSVPVLKAPPPPKRINSAAKDLPNTPTARGAASVTLKPTSPSLIPQPTYNSQPSGLTTPPKLRPSNAGSTLIPRLSISPKSSVKIMSPAPGTPTKTQSDPVTATKLTPPSKMSRMSLPPVFMPQPKMTSKSVTRSSLLPPKPPMLMPEQTATPAALPFKQGLTFKLSQQMQNLTSLWSPWSPSSNTSEKTVMELQTDTMPEQRRMTIYVCRERQLERLRRDLREDVVLTACEHCTNCRDDVIII